MAKENIMLSGMTINVYSIPRLLGREGWGRRTRGNAPMRLNYFLIIAEDENKRSRHISN